MSHSCKLDLLLCSNGTHSRASLRPFVDLRQCFSRVMQTEHRASSCLRPIPSKARPDLHRSDLQVFGETFSRLKLSGDSKALSARSGCSMIPACSRTDIISRSSCHVLQSNKCFGDDLCLLYWRVCRPPMDDNPNQWPFSFKPSRHSRKDQRSSRFEILLYHSWYI